jgi:hypothetical protein
VRCEQPTWGGNPCRNEARYAFGVTGAGQKVCGRHLNSAGAGMPYVPITPAAMFEVIAEGVVNIDDEA